MTLDLHATSAEVMRAVESLQALGEAVRIPNKILCGLTLALEECASNIVNHGLQCDARQTFRVIFEHSARKLVIELRDPGPPFDPTRVPAPAADAHDERPPGGWGILLVRRYVDEMHYSREGGENVLRLTKNLGDPP